MNYKVVDIPGNSDYNLKGIKLKNGKTFVYWTNKNARQISEVVVFMDNKSVAAIKDNQICISLNGIKDIQTQRECLRAFCDQLRVMGLDVKQIKFKFVVSNRNDKELVNKMINDLKLNGEILEIDNNRTRFSRAGSLDKDKLAKKENVEKKFNDDVKKELMSDGQIANVVTYNNGVRKDILIDKSENIARDVSYDSLSMNELMKIKFEDLKKNDPVMYERLFEMDEKEAFRLIYDMVNMDKKSHYMTDNASVDMTKMNAAERATSITASQNDGISNNELGVISNGSDKDNEFSIIESNSDKLREVSPDVSKIGVNESYSSSSQTSNGEFNNGEETEREEVNNVISYYVDDDGKVYNGNDAKVVEGAYCDENNRIVDASGDVLGFNCGNLDDMYANMPDLQNKENKRPLTKVYRKPLIEKNVNTSNKDAAFISFPVIIFIISLLLLIGSGIIWFITK